MAIYQLNLRSQKEKLEVQTHHLQRLVHVSDSTHESDDDAAPWLPAVLLQGKNEYSSSAKPYY